MSSLEEEIDQKIEEKELKAVKGHESKAKLKKAELLGIKFVTSEKGADLLNEISRVFDLVDVKQKDSKSEPIITVDKVIDQGKKVKFKVPINFLDHTEYLEYETTEAGLRHFKRLSDPNKSQREYDQAIAMENLTFIDGVLVTWEIFNRILDKRLRDENGNLEVDKNGFDYLGIINDDITTFLSDGLLEHGYFKTRRKQLCKQFGVNI